MRDEGNPAVTASVSSETLAPQPEDEAITHSITIADGDSNSVAEPLHQISADPPHRHDLPARPPLRAGMMFHHYQLIRQLGHGGMGAVYLARDTRLGRRVAMKFLAPKDATRAARFLSEARATARCEHENIVSIYHADEANGYSYMVLEYLEGMTLAQWMRQRWQPPRQPEVRELSPAQAATMPLIVASSAEPALGKSALEKSIDQTTLELLAPDEEEANTGPSAGEPAISPTLAVEVMVPVVRALAHAHRLGLVHRDLKPANIMLSDDGAIKVLDFGLAKVLDVDMLPLGEYEKTYDTWSTPALQSRDDALLGTMPYMSPEQWRKEEVDARTDIWAVGIILWELCTGRHPLAPMVRTRLARVGELTRPMPSLAAKRPDLKPVADIVDQCLVKNKLERIPSAEVLLDLLVPLLPGHDASARAPSSSHEFALPPASNGAPVRGDGVIEAESGRIGRPPSNPYVGLAAFQEQDAGRFFGRDREIASMIRQVRNHCLVAVVGASGSGKSSFVRAGLLPALARSGQAWEWFIVRPGRRPLAGLVSVMTQIVDTAADKKASASGAGSAFSPNVPDNVKDNVKDDVYGDMRDDAKDSLRVDLRAGLRAEPGALGTVLRARSQRRGTRILLVVDQFEELYTLGADRDTREAFMRCLEGVADDASSPLRVLLSVRADFVDRVAEDRSFMRQIARGLWFLPSMAPSELQLAVRQPAQAAGYEFEPALIDTMLAALSDTRSPLPLLQFTAAQLWEMRDRTRRRITRDSYQQLGGIAGALSAHADTVIASMSARERQIARAIFTCLVTEERTRAIISVEELRALGAAGPNAQANTKPITQANIETGAQSNARDDESSSPDSTVDSTADSTVDEVLQRLAEARLLLLETDFADDARDHSATVEIAHELLIEHWPKLGQWLREDHEEGRFRARLRTAARQWHQHNRAEALLWRDQAAIEAMRWLKSWQRRERERSDRAYRSRAASSASQGGRASTESVMVRLSGVTMDQALEHAGLGEYDLDFLRTVAARYARTRRRRRRIIATAFAVISAVAIGVSALAVYASKLADTAARQADEIAEKAALAEQRAALAASESMQARNASRMAGAREYQSDVNSDPTLVLALVREMEPSAKLPTRWRELARWAMYRGVAQTVIGQPENIYMATFSPNGDRIATASGDKLVRLWRADGTGDPVVLSGHRDVVYSVAFSPDGRRVVSGSYDGTVRIWSADGVGEPVVLDGQGGVVYSASFSPDGEHIVTASEDKIARVWRADGTGTPTLLRGHRDIVLWASFSPSGDRIVTTSYDKTARIWQITRDATKGGSGGGVIVAGAPRVLRGHEKAVYAAAFAPDGERIVTASGDKTARVWHLRGNRPPQILRGHGDVVYYAAFSPDGTRVVTASEDKSARVWNADGSGTPMILQGHQDSVWSAAFHPDGNAVVTASYDQSARVWNVDGSSKPLILQGHEDLVYSAVFSSSGDRVVTASFDKSVRVWPADGVGSAIVLSGHEDAVYSAEFSPDGKRVASASRDKTARVWSPNYTKGDTKGGTKDGAKPPMILRGHEDAVFSASFSPDGERLVTASRDHSARVWRLDGTGPAIVLRGHGGLVASAVFSPDGERIATASDDTTVRIWRADGVGEPIVLTGHTEPVWSVAFSPDGARLVTSSKDRTVRVWNADGSGEPVVLNGHSGGVFVGSRGKGAFSPDGARVVTISDDKTIRIWELDGPDQSGAQSGAQSIVVRAPELDAWSVAFDPSGIRIVSASHNMRSSAAGPVVHVAKILPHIRRFRGLDDHALWTATDYCPSIAQRMELLGMSEERATRDLDRCRKRVARARQQRTR